MAVLARCACLRQPCLGGKHRHGNKRPSGWCVQWRRITWIADSPGRIATHVVLLQLWDSLPLPAGRLSWFGDERTGHRCRVRTAEPSCRVDLVVRRQKAEGHAWKDGRAERQVCSAKGFGMNLRELKAIVAKGESERTEFKRSTGQRTEASKTVCALANGLGNHQYRHAALRLHAGEADPTAPIEALESNHRQAVLPGRDHRTVGHGHAEGDRLVSGQRESCPNLRGAQRFCGGCLPPGTGVCRDNYPASHPASYPASQRRSSRIAMACPNTSFEAAVAAGSRLTRPRTFSQSVAYACLAPSGALFVVKHHEDIPIDSSRLPSRHVPPPCAAGKPVDFWTKTLPMEGAVLTCSGLNPASSKAFDQHPKYVRPALNSEPSLRRTALPPRGRARR